MMKVVKYWYFWLVFSRWLVKYVFFSCVYVVLVVLMCVVIFCLKLLLFWMMWLRL